MAAFSAPALVRRPRAGAWWVLPLLAALAFPAGPAAAQVRPLPQAPPTANLPRTEVPLALAGDLAIASVTVRDTLAEGPKTVAYVTIHNGGVSAVTFPAGSMLARGEPGAAGGIAFQPLATPTAYTIGPAESKVLTLTVGDPCTSGRQGDVTFRVDPDNKVRESNEANNTFKVAGASSYAAADLVVFQTDMRVGPNHENRDLGLKDTANLDVWVQNKGSGPALLCPGLVIFRETASLNPAKWGYRSVKTGAAAVRLAPYGILLYTLENGYMPGDAPTAKSYYWTVKINPDGQISETNTANNDGRGNVQVWPTDHM